MMIRKKAGAWALFLITLLLLSFSATRYSAEANFALISLRVGILAVLSILVLRETFGNRHAPDSGDRLLQRWRNWYRGE